MIWGGDNPTEQSPPSSSPSIVLFVSNMQKMLSHPGRKDNSLLFISIIFKGASLYLFAVWLNIYYLYLIFPDSKGHHQWLSVCRFSAAPSHTYLCNLGLPRGAPVSLCAIGLLIGLTDHAFSFGSPRSPRLVISKILNVVETKEFSELKPGSFLSLLKLRFQFPFQGDGQIGVTTVGPEGSEKDWAVSWQDMDVLTGVPGCWYVASHPATSSWHERLALIRLQAAD